MTPIKGGHDTMRGQNRPSFMQQAVVLLYKVTFLKSLKSHTAVMTNAKLKRRSHCRLMWPFCRGGEPSGFLLISLLTLSSRRRLLNWGVDCQSVGAPPNFFSPILRQSTHQPAAAVGPHTTLIKNAMLKNLVIF